MSPAQTSGYQMPPPMQQGAEAPEAPSDMQMAMEKLIASNKGRQSSHTGAGFSAMQGKPSMGLGGLLGGINAMGGGQQPNRQMAQQPTMNPFIQSLLGM